MTKAQYIVYLEIKKYIDKYGYSPSVRELCKLSGKSSTGTIRQHLVNLKKLGYIDYIDKKSRTIRIIKDFKCYYE